MLRLPGKRQESGCIEERGKKPRLGGQHVAEERNIVLVLYTCLMPLVSQP